MMSINKKLAAALAVPMICLALLCAYKAIHVMAGKTVVIPITGFDPRDILSGHYLTYRLKIETGNACQNDDRERDSLALCLSLNDKGVVAGSYPVFYDSIDEAENKCDAILQGKCERGHFIAGVERFYIPENESVFLDSAVRSGEGAVIVSVDRNGKAVVKDLLINGKPWRDAVKKNTNPKMPRH